jgi:ubiquinone/menaquinone biosynthesis C-methylase UbiE
MDAAAGPHRYLGGSRPSERKTWADLNAWMHMQALQWEPAGAQLLSVLGDGSGLRALDLGCGPLGWLRVLSSWVGPTGKVVGTEVSEDTAEPARLTVRSEGLSNVSVVVDDVFDSWLPEGSFDLVHARLLLGPLGRHEEQLATYRRLVKPGGWLVLEETVGDTWRFNPSAPACQRLMELVIRTFDRRGRDLNVGRQLRSMLRRYAQKPELRAHILALPSGHVYSSTPLIAAAAFREVLVEEMGVDEFDSLVSRAEEELRDPELWCTTFVMVQAFARLP